MPFLDIAICNELRDTINSSPIFTEIEEYSKHFNQICAVMDRVQTSVNYLNNHNDYPKSEEELICFMVFSCMIVDASKYLFKDILNDIAPNKKRSKFFKEICKNKPFSLSDEECLTDDEFFEYIRSLIFAHPYETSRNKTLRQKFGKQVSPWVFLDCRLLKNNSDNCIGIRMYTSKKDEYDMDSHSIYIPFSLLKDYISSRYSDLKLVIEWLKQQIQLHEDKWKKHKIDRTKNKEEILNQIITVLQERFVETYEIEEIKSLLFCDISLDENKHYINQFRKNIESKLVSLYDSVDNMDYDSFFAIIREMLSYYPKNLHEGGHYQLEKIFSYLKAEYEDSIYEGSNAEWGLIQAEAFYKQFAYKWVKIDVRKMSFAGIRLLVSVACFMQIQEEKLIGSD